MKNLRAIFLLFFLSLFIFFLLPTTDPDLGWQIRCGEEIWQRHSLCSVNRFTVLLKDYSWPNHYWLYQAMVFPLYKLGGFGGLTIFNALLMSLAFLFFYLAIKNYLWEKILAAGLIIFWGWGVFSSGLRSQLFSFFFSCLILFLSTKLRQKTFWAAILPLIILVWANVHGGSVILGLILLFFLLTHQAVYQPKKIPLFIFVYLMSLSFTLFNPFGVAIYQDAWRHFAGVNLAGLIAEWVPPSPLAWWSILLSALGLSLLVLLRPQKRENLFWLLLLFPFVILALKARRNVPFYWLIWFYILFKQSLIKDIWLKKEVIFLMFFVFFFFGLFLRLPLTIHTNLSLTNYCQDSNLSYPCGAVNFLRQQAPANVFNRYEWGGFLLWQLPEFNFFVDGRMPAWETPSHKSPYTIYLEILQTQPGWENTLKEYNISWILISPGTFMDLLLRPEPQKYGWQEAYRDQVSVIYQKVNHASY